MTSLTKENERDAIRRTEKAHVADGGGAPSEVREEYANEARRRTMSISETSAEHDVRARQPTDICSSARIYRAFSARAPANSFEDSRHVAKTPVPFALTSRWQIKSFPSRENELDSVRHLRQSHNSSTLGRNCEKNSPRQNGRLY